MQKAPDPSVVEWLDRQPAESVWITSITLFEARLGLALLPKGRRSQALELAFEQLLAEDLEERVLDFDRSAAEAAHVRTDPSTAPTLWRFVVGGHVALCGEP